MKSCDEGFFTPRAPSCLPRWQFLPPRRAVAQQATTLTISSRTLEVENFLRQGRQLELQRRWGEALVTHYEDALRLYPDEQSLERRFESARLHYDLGRRYADRSFCRSLTQLSPQQALDLYAGRAGEDPDALRRGAQLAATWWPAGPATSRWRWASRSSAEQNIPARDWPAIEPFRRGGPQDAGRADRGNPPGRLRRRGGGRRAGPATPRDRARPRRSSSASAGRPTAWIRIPPTSPRTSSARSIRRSRGISSAWGSSSRRRGASWSWCGSSAAAPPKRPASTPRDRILAIDGRSVKEVPPDQAANLLQGREGTTVALSVAAAGRPAAR